MGILTEGLNCVPGVWGAAAVAKSCEYCHSTAALLFCRTDNMFMCLSCDSRVHENARHERVWVCEVCEQAPAVVTCKADAAALCVMCDRDIHSANPLSRRHERIPVIPFHEAVEPVVKSTAATLLGSINNPNTTTTNTTPVVNACMGHHEEDHMTDSIWISSNTVPSKISAEMKSMDLLFSDNETLIDFDYAVSVDTQSQPNYNSANDSVVPFNHHEKHFEIDFTRSHIKSYSSTQSLCHSVSSSSLEVGVVPEGSSISEISYNFGRSMSSSSGNSGDKLMGVDREARVMRYREKRKNRKFEKTIRYASRKAYAETRPRIKGRFAKRTDAGEVDSDADQIFPGVDFIRDDLRYGVVPSFY